MVLLNEKVHLLFAKKEKEIGWGKKTKVPYRVFKFTTFV